MAISLPGGVKVNLKIQHCTIDDKQVRSAYNGINRIVENNRVVAWGQVR